MSIGLIVLIVYIISIFGAWFFIRIEKQGGNNIDNGLGIIAMLMPPVNMMLTGVLILYLVIVELICIRILHTNKWTWNKFWGI
jgi:glycerol-3-phosphate acyltransferase PlsY